MPALIVRRAVLRGVIFWIGLRLLLLLVAGAGRSVSHQPGVSGLEGHPLLFPAIIVALAWYDLWRRNEVIFLANLGIGLPVAVALYAAPVLLLEMLSALLA